MDPVLPPPILDPNGYRTRAVRTLLFVALAYMTCASLLHLAWIRTGTDGWILSFRFLTVQLFVAMAAATTAQAMAVRRRVAVADADRRAWTLFVGASIVRWVGHALSSASVLWSAWTDVGSAIAHVGRVLAGPGFMVVLLVALAILLRDQRRRGGAPVRLTLLDVGLGSAVVLFAVQFLWDLSVWRQQPGFRAGVLDAISWSSDPLLAILLLQAIVLRRGAIANGEPFASRCWTAVGAGLLLMSLGDVGLWLAAHGRIAWPWTSLFWYVWPLAETAFAVAPAWQLAEARGPSEREPRAELQDARLAMRVCDGADAAL